VFSYVLMTSLWLCYGFAMEYPWLGYFCDPTYDPS